jgi:hypothetical protein
MKRTVKGLTRWDGKVLSGFFTISKTEKLKQPVVSRAKRTRGPNAPAPGLRPPGVRGPQPQKQGYAMETWQKTKRDTLRKQLADRVRGLIPGRGSLANVDWERFKLSEALWSRAKRQEVAKQTQQRVAEKAPRQKAAQRSNSKTKTRVRAAPAFDKVQQRGRMTPEKAYQQQEAQAAQKAPQPVQKFEKGQLSSTTEHLFKPPTAQEKAAQMQRNQQRGPEAQRERER